MTRARRFICLMDGRDPLATGEKGKAWIEDASEWGGLGFGTAKEELEREDTQGVGQ